LLAELISISVGSLAGFGLAVMSGRLEEYAGLLIMVPSFLEMRNAISGQLSSRVGTALHLGVVKAVYKFQKDLTQNIYASLILGFVVSLYIGILSNILCLIFGFPSAGIEKLVLIAIIAGTIANISEVLLSVFSTIFFWRRGIDPDDIMGPYITSIGDIISIISLFISTGIVSGG